MASGEVPSTPVWERVSRLVSAKALAWHRIVGGHTAAERWIAHFDDGSSAFVKAATSAETTAWLRTEYYVYTHVSASFMPTLLGWDDGDCPILLLENLQDAIWPPPWSGAQIQRIRSTLTELAATRPPRDLPMLESFRADLMGWRKIAEEPAPFLSLRLCSAEWLSIALPTLLAAEATAQLSGDSLVHLDVRSDNICFAGDRTILIDWNWACRGNALMDLAAWLPSLNAEGGPAPAEIMPDTPAFAALMAGYFASKAGLPPPRTGSKLRDLQMRQLKAALPWAVRTLLLPDPLMDGN